MTSDFKLQRNDLHNTNVLSILEIVVLKSVCQKDHKIAEIKTCFDAL
jgi:hypothetical protein